MEDNYKQQQAVRRKAKLERSRKHLSVDIDYSSKEIPEPATTLKWRRPKPSKKV